MRGLTGVNGPDWRDCLTDLVPPVMAYPCRYCGSTERPKWGPVYEGDWKRVPVRCSDCGAPARSMIVRESRPYDDHPALMKAWDDANGPRLDERARGRR